MLTSTGYLRTLRKCRVKMNAAEITSSYGTSLVYDKLNSRLPRRYRWHRKLFLNRMRREGLV